MDQSLTITRQMRIHNYYTTLKGVMEKEDPDNREFVVPSNLEELVPTTKKLFAFKELVSEQPYLRMFNCSPVRIFVPAVTVVLNAASVDVPKLNGVPIRKSSPAL